MSKKWWGELDPQELAEENGSWKCVQGSHQGYREERRMEMGPPVEGNGVEAGGHTPFWLPVSGFLAPSPRLLGFPG